VIVIAIFMIIVRSQVQQEIGSESAVDEDAVTTETAVSELGEEDVQEINDGTYSIDPDTSVVTWKGTAIGKEHVGDVRIKDGTIMVQDRSVSDGSIVVEMTSISDHDLDSVLQEQLVQHLKSDDFFAVETYPEATLRFTDVMPTSYAGVYTVTADLTIRDVTHPISFDLIIRPDGDGAMIATADVVIDRTQWGITFGSERFAEAIGATIIDDEIFVHMQLRGVMEK
jgi:polyisoprenoid-binding protein YceI